jgi:tRNA/rRNA methyltransferase
VRGLAKLLRRNPTDAERMLWAAMMADRRFAGLGFKRQVPIGPHIVDVVSFPLRIAVDITPGEENADAARGRADKLAWLRERDYRVVEIAAREIERAPDAVCEQLAQISRTS